MEKVSSQKGEGLQMLLAADVHLGNVSFQIESFKEGTDSTYILNLGKILEKIMMAARVITSMDNPQDVIVQSTSRPYEHKDVLRFTHYIGAQPLMTRQNHDIIINQMKKSFTELCVTDPSIDFQPIKVAALKSHLIDEP
ncbi:hypothetical protein MKX03_030082, partial [Papaver bracteatum]